MRFNSAHLVVLFAFACNGGGLEIVGDYTDGFGDHSITEDTWTQDFGEFGISSFDIVEYDNAGSFLIAQNGADNAYFGEMFSRFDWTFVEDELYYCQTVFDAADADAARSTEAADASDPATAGCGGYPWSPLTPQ